MSNTFAHLLKSTLCGKSTPVFFWREQGQIVAVSAANLWTLALRRRHELREKGLKPGEIWCSSALDFSLIIDLVACAISGNPFFPCHVSSTTTEQNASIERTVKPSSEASLFLFLPNSSPGTDIRTDIPSVILEEPDTNIVTRLHTEKLMAKIYSALDHLKPSADEIRLSCLKPHTTAVLINDVLCGMLARQTVYIDFHEDAFQHPEILDKIAREEGISTLAISPFMCNQLAMTPTEIREQFNLGTVYCVETLEIY